jgi:hypothetical protein
MAIRNILAVGAVIAWLVCAASMLGMMYYAFRARYHRAPDAPNRWIVSVNPFQSIWFADQLSARGLEYRAIYIKLCRVFFGVLLAFFVFRGLIAISPK